SKETTDSFTEALDDTSLTPSLEGYFFGVRQIFSKELLETTYTGFVPKHCRELEIQAEASHIEVGAADRRELSIDHDGFGVKHPGQIFVHVHSRSQQLIVEASAGMEGKRMIGKTRDQEAYVDASQSSCLECYG